MKNNLGSSIDEWIKDNNINGIPNDEYNRDGYIITENLGGYSGQSNNRKYIHNNGNKIGYLDYSFSKDNEPYINMIYVDPNYRRKGYGTKLMKSLQADFPNSTIHTGYTTDEGTPFIEKITYTKDNPKYKWYQTRKSNLEKKISDIDKQWDKNWEDIDNGLSGMSVEDAISLQNKQDNIRRQLRGLKEPRNKYFRYVK